MTESLGDILRPRMIGGNVYREWAAARKFKACEPKNPWNKEVHDLYFNRWTYLFKRKDESARWEIYRNHLVDESLRVLSQLEKDNSVILGQGERSMALSTAAPVNPYELTRQIYDIYQSDLYIRPDKDFTSACGQRWIDFLENIEYHGSYETAGGYIDKGDVVFDVGAGYGVFTLLAMIQGARGVHAFEPNPDAAKIFVKNMLLNNITKDNLRFSPLAIMNNRERKNLLWDSNYPCGGRIVKHSKAERLQENRNIETVDSTTIDHYINSYKINRLDFLKVSAPNCELEVLEGAINALTKFKPKMSIEVGYNNSTEKEVINFIEQVDPNYVCQKRAFKVQASLGDD